MKKFLTALAATLVLLFPIPAFAQPADADYDQNGCVTKEELLQFYIVDRPELEVQVVLDTDRSFLLSSPYRPQDLAVFFDSLGCADPRAIQMDKGPLSIPDKEGDVPLNKSGVQA